MTHQIPATSGVFFPCAHFAITNIVSIYIYFMRVRIVEKMSSPYLSHCLSVRLNHMYQRSYHWMDFREIWYWGLLKICREIPNLLQAGTNIGHMKTWVFSIFCQWHIAHLRQQCYNSKLVIFQEKHLKVWKCYTFLRVQTRHNCFPAASFTNCVMTV
jgi:hypothetical protein